jgi:dual specificity phosphatase 12
MFANRIKLDDDPNEVLMKHFSETNAFIDAALSRGGAVFVHCAMGKSRSATVVIAYLMWKYGATPEAALKQLCEGREVCDPNPGFKEQLKVYERMLHAKDEAEQQRIFQKWLDTRYTGTWYSGMCSMTPSLSFNERFLLPIVSNFTDNRTCYRHAAAGLEAMTTVEPVTLFRH